MYRVNIKTQVIFGHPGTPKHIATVNASPNAKINHILRCVQDNISEHIANIKITAATTVKSALEYNLAVFSIHNDTSLDEIYHVPGPKGDGQELCLPYLSLNIIKYENDNEKDIH